MTKLIICVALAGVFNSIMDKLQFGGLGGNSQFWNPQLSWHNKHRDLGHTFIANIIEALDNTVLSFLTDGWHLMKFCMTSCFIIALIPPVESVWIWIIFFIGAKVIFGTVFTVFYHGILQWIKNYSHNKN